MNLLDAFHEHSQHQPAQIALWVSGREYSYGELGARVRSLAGWISRTADKPNPRVGILTSRSLTAYVGILAATYAGAAYVPLNYKAPHHYLDEVLNSASPDLLIVDETGADIVRSGSLTSLPAIIIAPFASEVPPSSGILTGDTLEDHQPMSAPAATQDDDTAYLMFTSGTTGKPKGIAITVRNILHLLTVLQQRYRFSPEDRVSQAFELTFDLSVFDIFMALRAGASLHVVPDHQMPMPARFIQQQALTVWFSVPTMIGMLKQMKLLRPGAFPSLRLSLFCGEALPAESARSWQEAAPDSRVENLYGPTEATVACLLQDAGAAGAVTPGRGIVAIGHPFPGLQAGIVDEDGNFLPPGEKGELAVHGPQVAPGYLDNPELTELRFPILDHPELGRTRWYRTGDLAYLDAEGRYHFLGRGDNQVQLRGYRVELDEIEHHLRAVTDRDTAAALFFDHPQLWAQEIIGVVPPCGLESEEIRSRLRRRLPPYMVPKRVVITETWPRNASGKIDRKALLGLVRGDGGRSDG